MSLIRFQLLCKKMCCFQEKFTQLAKKLRNVQCTFCSYIYVGASPIDVYKVRWFQYLPNNRGIYAISHIWQIWWFFGWKYEVLELSKELSFGLNLFWSEYWPWFWSKYQTLVLGLVTVVLLISLVWMNSHTFADYCPVSGVGQLSSLNFLILQMYI